VFDDLDLADLRRRQGTKWSSAAEGVIPAWLADMDFPPPPPVREVLRRGADGGLVYPDWDDHPERNPLLAAFTERMAARATRWRSP